MNNLKFSLFSFICLFVVFACTKNDDGASTNIDLLDPALYYKELNVPYGTDNNQTYDIYLPANRTKNTKTMILVHGGGWSAGDKSVMNDFKNFVREQHPNLGVVT
jgi:acetyl esterase/lipase